MFDYSVAHADAQTTQNNINHLDAFSCSSPVLPSDPSSGGFFMISVLFARKDSIYKSLPGCDVYDEERDALSFTGNNPVIAHPPCRAWGRLRKFAKPVPYEKDLARFAVAMVRSNGGVLEHPAASTLWQDQSLPGNHEYDEFGGFTIHVDQHSFGHKAKKSTALYICGIRIQQLPTLPLDLAQPEYVVRPSRNGVQAKIITKIEREATPINFALWLLDTANMIANQKIEAIPTKQMNFVHQFSRYQKTKTTQKLLVPVLVTRELSLMGETFTC